MRIEIDVPADVEARLRERAAENGQELEIYVAQLLQRFTEAPRNLEELSGPIYRRFLDSGMSDDELAEELERAKHTMRAERRAGGS